MVENMDEIKNKAQQSFSDSKFIWDQPLRVKRALVWKLEYDCEESKREHVQNLDKCKLRELLRKYRLSISESI